MSRKELITAEKIVDTAFEIVREEGYLNMTARKVALRAQCSTQPIFRLFSGMDELCEAVYDKSISFFRDFYNLYPRMGNRPFTNLGMGYIAFAKQEKRLFEFLFLSNCQGKRSMYEIINGKTGNVVAEIAAAQEEGCPQPEKMFMKLWIFIHGAACMSLTGDYDLSNMETMELLENSYDDFMRSMRGTAE